jgi:hypothetical protein
MLKERSQAQLDRYASGLHMAVDYAEWKKLVKYKLVQLKNNPSNPAHYNGNPSGGIGFVLGALAAGVIAWLLLKPKTASASTAQDPAPTLPPPPKPLNPCTILDKHIEAFGKAKGYNVWWIENQPVATWTAPVKEQYTSDKQARAFSVYECMLYKWEQHEGAPDSWVKDMKTAAEFEAWRAESGL